MAAIFTGIFKHIGEVNTLHMVQYIVPLAVRLATNSAVIN